MASLHISAVGFLTVPNCDSLTFFEACQCSYNVLSLARNHIREQETEINVLIFENLG